VITTSPSLLRFHPSPPLEVMVVREPPVSFFRHGFLLPRNPSSPLIEVGYSSRGGDFKEAIGYPEAMFDAMLCLQPMGISFEGNVKDFFRCHGLSG